MPLIEIYTDGSCHTQLLNGAWAALVFIDVKKTILKGTGDNFIKARAANKDSHHE